MRFSSLEQRKGNVNLRTENPDYPSTFLTDAKKLLNEGKVVVSPFIEHVFKAYDNSDFKSSIEDVRVILDCPTLDNFDEYVDRFKQRGNGAEFITRREKEFSSLVKLFQDSDNYERITIKSGQFLSEALEEYGITLKPKVIVLKK